MKEIKAYVHRNRIADVIAAIEQSGLNAPAAEGVRNINITSVHGLLKPIDSAEQRFSVELGETVIDEVRLELVCADGQVDDLVALIADAALTGQSLAGWIVVTDIVRIVPIAGGHR